MRVYYYFRIHRKNKIVKAGNLPANKLLLLSRLMEKDDVADIKRKECTETEYLNIFDELSN